MAKSRFPLLERIDVPASAEGHLLTAAQKVFVEDYLSVSKSRTTLEKNGVNAGTNLLLYGPPGCGKSHLAAYIAWRFVASDVCRPT